MDESRAEPSETPPAKVNVLEKLSELGGLANLALARAEAGDYLRSYVALKHLEELSRHGAKPVGSDELSADDIKRLNRLLELIGDHIDVNAVECHEDYVLYRKAIDSEPWKQLLKSLKGRRGLLAMRVFLEDSSLEEAIQLRGERGCNMLALDSMSKGALVQIADGEPAVVSRTGGGDCADSP